jgi:uncharacterized damage-inducible protein DinB
MTSDARDGFGETFLLNDRVNQLLLEHLDPKAWCAKPEGKGMRTIAAIFSHMHNVRRKWLRLSAPHLKLPAELNRARCTQKQAAAALVESAQLCAEMLSDERVTQFVRDGWAKPWGVAPSTTLRDAFHAEGEKQILRRRAARFAQDDNEKINAKTKVEAGRGMSPGAAAMLAYMVSHEAHHRGQVCMLAHQMGYRLPMKVMSKMWAWEGLSRHHAKTARDGDPEELAVQGKAPSHPITRKLRAMGTPASAQKSQKPKANGQQVIPTANRVIRE